jgi:hypothetical protein
MMVVWINSIKGERLKEKIRNDVKSKTLYSDIYDFVF